jgi:hypothetical protein
LQEEWNGLRSRGTRSRRVRHCSCSRISR